VVEILSDIFIVLMVFFYYYLVCMAEKKPIPLLEKYADIIKEEVNVKEIS
jgi:hypothetical protein